MSDIKSMLKEAREAIKNKDYETSLKLCKQILKEKKGNYTALVFLAVSFQELGQFEQALKTFNEAIKNEPSNILAWNGLLNFYEKKTDDGSKTESIQLYIKLLTLETNEKKIVEYSQKMCKISEFGDISEIATSIHQIILKNKCNDPSELWSCLVNLLSKPKILPENLTNLYEDSLHNVLENPKTICTEYYAHYLNFLYKEKRLEELLEHAKKMHLLFEIDTISLKWICKIFNETFIETAVMLEGRQQIVDIADRLLKLEANSPTGLLTKSIFLVEDKQFADAKITLKQIIEICPGLVHAHILLFKIHTKFDALSEALATFTKIEKLVKSSDKVSLKKSLQLILIECLSKSTNEEDLNKVIEFEESEEIVPYKIRAYTNLGDYKQAQLLLQKLENNDKLQIDYKLLKAQLLHKQSKYAEALIILDMAIESSDWWLEIGALYWDSGDFEKSLVPFLKAAKYDPANYKCFLYLGHYYRVISDFDKARRCYEKSFKLNNQCSEAGIELSKIYRQLKKWDANLILLQSLTNEVINKKNSWAWMQLGLDYCDQGQYDKAINYLRYVVRIDSLNMHCWECLADAYLAKGAFTSALKCYQKASELSEGAVYPLLQMANIKHILGNYVEACDDFNSILSENKVYVPALKGLAETYLCQGKEYFREQRKGTARDRFQLSSEKLLLAIQQRSDLSCLWKLLADCCYFVTKLPEKFCCLLLPKNFVDNQSDENENKILLKNDLYILAARCYYKSLSLNDNNLLIWHDLATCYLSQGISENAQEFIKKSIAIAQYCALTNPTNWQFWNLLGYAAFNLSPPNYKLAQHAFIKAVIADNNCAIAWCNLGTLYLVLDNYKLANEAFSQAQRSDPNYVNSWIGQAMLAEHFGHEDAMDLYRHSTQLGMHQQGALGYGHWVCQTLKSAPLDAVLYSIHNMHAIPVACDNLLWYTESNPDDPCAWNLLGILLERLKLEKTAMNAFASALYLIKGQPQKDYATVNTARLLAKCGKYSNAAKMYAQIEAATFNSGSGYALALFKDNNFEKSYEAYEQALHWLAEENSQSDLLVALASMAYMFQGADAAKILLFQSIQLKKPSPWSFYATIALALLHNDNNLAELVFKELQNLKYRPDCIQNYASLACIYYLIQGKSKKAISELSKLIHCFPDQAYVWSVLSQLLIRLNYNKSAVAAKCALNAMKLGQNNMDVTKILCLVSLSLYTTKSYQQSFLMAQKAVHCYPNIAEGWTMLASSLNAIKKVGKQQITNIFNFIQTLNCNKDLNEWVHKSLATL